MNNHFRFNKSRLAIARQRRGMTKKALSAKVGITTRSLTNFESEESDETPSAATLSTLATALEFPESFFFGDDLEVPTADNASFRSFSRMTAAQRDSALAAGALAFAFCDWISNRFNLPAPNIPDLSGFGPEEAADIVRAEWRIGDKPIKNMVHLLESKGARVFSLVQDSSQVNAFSCWQNGDTPFVFLNTYKSSESSRFDAAHELGHLVLHRQGDNKGKHIENEANAFASALLMPKTSVLKYASRAKTVDELVSVKKVWGVSAMALAFRLHKLNVLSDWVYRSLCVEMSSRGMRKDEPSPIKRESSQVLSKVLEILRDKNLGTNRIASELSVAPEELKKLLFGLATVSLDGHGNSDVRTQSTNKLRLVQ